MGKYKQVTETLTVEDGLDLSEIESLRDEMEEWVDNMGGTALENTNRYQMASDAKDTLDNVDEIRFEEIWEVMEDSESLTEEGLKALTYQVVIFRPKSRRQSTSRAYRLSNALSVIDGALGCLETFLEPYSEEEVGEVRKAISNISSQVQDLDSVDFPGMYG